jgi:hypothetical protein
VNSIEIRNLKIKKIKKFTKPKKKLTKMKRRLESLRDILHLLEKELIGYIKRY